MHTVHKPPTHTHSPERAKPIDIATYKRNKLIFIFVLHINLPLPIPKARTLFGAILK